MIKKYSLLLLAAYLFTACRQPTAIEFDVTATGLTNGVFIVKDQGRQAVFGANLKDGKCMVKGYLEQPGFYQLDIVNNTDKPHQPFEVYLEATRYTITTTKDGLTNYPTIVTNCKKQQEISNYNALYQQMAGATLEQLARLNSEMENQGKKLPLDTYRKLITDIADGEDTAHEMQFAALRQFVKKYPGSELSAHFMAQQHYTEQPGKYLKLFNQLSPAAKASDDGKEVNKALLAVNKLQPGNAAPAIEGKTFDGKTFASITAGKKLFLIDFWRSANQFSRTNHDRVIKIYYDLKGQGFQVISVSLDSRPLWWGTAVKDDKLPWPQMSDLKGNDSPNAANWNITTVPTYYLVDANWKIYKNDIALGGIQLAATEYFEKKH